MKTSTRILVAAMWILAACGGGAVQTGTQLSKVGAAAMTSQGECTVDSDCGPGEICKQFCGNGWCGNVCIQSDDPAPVTSECQSDADCAAGQTCQTFCGNGWCKATCIDNAPAPDPVDECLASCPIGACIAGASCWSDGNDYFCNDCVAACHGASRIDCAPAPTPAPTSDVAVDATASGTTVSMKVGQSLTVSLGSLGDAGYSNWAISTAPDASILASVSSQHLAGNPNLVGDFGTDVFKFQAQQAGQTSLTATATRSWSGETQTFTVTLDIQ